MHKNFNVYSCYIVKTETVALNEDCFILKCFSLGNLIDAFGATTRNSQEKGKF